MCVFDECVDECPRVFVRRPDQHHVTRVAFYQRRDRAVVADDVVSAGFVLFRQSLHEFDRSH